MSSYMLHAINSDVSTDGLGPLLFSPLSEVPFYGRNIPYITSLVIFVALCVPTALVDNYTGFMILRLLQGFFGSPCLASGGASMADMVRAKMSLSGRDCISSARADQTSDNSTRTFTYRSD
jgi:MFS family permease